MSEENANIPLRGLDTTIPSVNRNTQANIPNTHSIHLVYNQEDRSSSTDSLRSEDYFSRQWSVLASMVRTQQTLSDCFALLMHDERDDE